MKSKILCIATFLGGLGMGSLITWVAIKDYYRQKEEEAVESVKKSLDDYYNSKERAKMNEELKEEQANIILTNSYSSKTLPVEKHETESSSNETEVEESEEKIEMNNPVTNDVPYSISPEDFAEITDYDVRSLFLYADGVVASNDDIPIENPTELLGDDYEDYIGEYEEDCAYIRNDQLETDFELLVSSKTYSEHMKIVDDARPD